MKVSSTINPIHFEDLEPHRFEDLVRQLAYDFRQWQSLEGLGRLGNDEGFDARGREILGFEPDSSDDDSDDEERIEDAGQERIWLIQCKREKQIAPKKMKGYAGEIKKQADNLYGVIFVAACDFSKKTRDALFEELRDTEIQEIHIWGKAELEDMLFQPKNDHLLFAYFGISLSIRRRGAKS